MRVLRPLSAFAVLALSLAIPKPCGAFGLQQPRRVTAPFWREVGHPGAERARNLLRQARFQLRQAQRQLPEDWQTVCQRTRTRRLSADNAAVREGRMRALRQLMRQMFKRRAHLDSALARLERAEKLNPDDAEIRYARAQALASWEQPGPLWGCSALRRNGDAIEALQALSRVDPQFAASQVAFELAVLFTRERRYEEAVAAYRKAIGLALDARETTVMRSNMAEVTMLSGKLEEALGHYERALELTHGGRDYMLSLWGLAVALSRLGEQEAALQRARRAVDADGGQLRVLRSDGVFFEPQHEIHYYEALGHEALAQRDPAREREQLEAARTSWQAFLHGAGPQGPWAGDARQNLERIEARLQALRGTHPR